MWQAMTLSEEHERELKKIFDDYDQVQWRKCCWLLLGYH
jgi:hypothetical protein